jgi:hypothetical protein
VAEKHDFCGIQRKIPQVSDFAKKRDLNPPPHGGTAADIAKMFAKKICKNRISGRKTQFSQKIPQTKSRKSDSAKNFFSRFLQFFRYHTIFAKIGIFRKNWRFLQKSAFLRKIL